MNHSVNSLLTAGCLLDISQDHFVPQIFNRVQIWTLDESTPVLCSSAYIWRPVSRDDMAIRPSWNKSQPRNCSCADVAFTVPSTICWKEVMQTMIFRRCLTVRIQFEFFSTKALPDRQDELSLLSGTSPTPYMSSWNTAEPIRFDRTSWRRSSAVFRVPCCHRNQDHRRRTVKEPTTASHLSHHSCHNRSRVSLWVIKESKRRSVWSLCRPKFEPRARPDRSLSTWSCLSSSVESRSTMRSTLLAVWRGF